MPQNFYFIPLIVAALPEAKIIHVQRNAAAICWSNFKKYFVKNGLGFSYDLSDTVEYYKHTLILLSFGSHNTVTRLHPIMKSLQLIKKTKPETH